MRISNEPTQEEILKLIRSSEDKVRYEAIQDYHSTMKERNNHLFEKELEDEIGNMNYIQGLEIKHPRYFKGLKEVIPQVKLYQIKIVGLYNGVPVTVLPTDDEFIYIPIGSYIFARYTHSLEFVELCSSQTQTDKQFVSVLEDAETRVIKQNIKG